MTDPTIKQIRDHPTTSTWLRDALATGLQRDPVDAERDAAVLLQLLQRRAREALGCAQNEPAAPCAPDGIVGEVVEMGDDEAGNPRLLIATTREAIRGHAGSLAFRRVRVSLAPASSVEPG